MSQNMDNRRAGSGVAEGNGDILLQIWRRIPSHIKWCFCSGFLSGLLVHAYMLTNKLPNWDDINNLGGYGVGSEFGRWFLKYVNPLDGVWSVPWLGGIFSIALISVAGCMLLSALELRSTTSAILVPLMMMSFPSMCSLFTFMFTADCYAVGILFACTAAWLIRKYRFGFIPGIVLLVLSMGIYQAYLCLALGILVCGLFFDLLKEKNEKRIFVKGLWAFLILVISAVIYMALARLIYPDLGSQNGLDQMGRIELSRLPRLILRAYKWVAEYFILKPWSYVTGFAWFLNVLSALAAAGFVIFSFFRGKFWKKPVAAALFVFLAAAIPLAMGSIIIMAPDASVSLLMLYQFHLLYVFVIAMLEKTQLSGSEKKQKMVRLIGPAVVVLILLVGYQNFVVTNEAYFRMDVAYERAYAYYNRIMARIEATEGYQTGDAIALIGEYGLSKTPDLLGSYSLDGERYEDLSGVAKETGLLTSGVRHNFMKTYIGVEMPDVSAETEAAIRASEEYQNMPSYPAEGCVKQIEGVWVVKTCEETLE